MASAEMLKMTRDIDNKVMGVDDGVKDVEGKVQDVRGDVQDARVDVQDVGSKVQGIDDKVQGIGSDVKDISSGVCGVDDKLYQINRSLSLTIAHHSECSDSFTGNQLRDSLLRWLSPPDPSINHNIASKAHHNGTAQCFFQGRMFDQWKSDDPLLWIHGKRALLLTFVERQSLICSVSIAGSGKSVLWFVLLRLVPRS